MNATEALDHLNPKKWAATGPAERLALLEAVRSNLSLHQDELAATDTGMKNSRLGENVFDVGGMMAASVVPVGATINAMIDVYELLVQGKMPEPAEIKEVGNDLWDITVRRLNAKERLLFGNQREVLRVKGKPTQVNPYDNPAGIISVAGAGNYSSSLEMVNALFLENCAVVHKPHELNIATDRVWEKIFRPLIDHEALAFVEEDPERLLTSDKRINRIYFTGSTRVAQIIMAHTDIPLISECGGNNPVIIVPGNHPWTAKEMAHQAEQIISAAKLNGGAVCGRGQTLVTSKRWPQREEFLDAIRKAITDGTFAAGSYYPGSDNAKARFLQAYPDAEVLKPEGGKHAASDFILIPDVKQVSYATQNEAFCQILGEVALDVPATASEFLPAAAEFANTNLLGTLGCAILIDEDTKSAHQAALDQAVTTLNYGGISINEMPPAIWISPYLTWGGNEKGKTFVSGIGNFGNALNYQHVEKSILTGSFVSPTHLLTTHKKGFAHTSTGVSRFVSDPTWSNLTRLMGNAITDSFRRKDF